MKKETLYKVTLILLPILAIIFGCGSHSVAIRDRATDAVTYQSYFALLPEGTFSIAMLSAMLGTLVVLIAAVAYGITGKETCLKGIYLAAFAAVFASEMPGFFQSELMVMASIPVSLLLIVECTLAYFKMKKPRDKTEKPGKRLDRR